jgi:hypothetical protein
MATRMKLQTFSRKQDFSVQMHIQTDLDMWNSTMGRYQAVKHQNNPEASIKSLTHHYQCSMVRFELHTTK